MCANNSVRLAVIGFSALLVAPSVVWPQTTTGTKTARDTKAARGTKAAGDTKPAHDTKADRGAAFNDAMARAARNGQPLLVLGVTENCSRWATLRDGMANDADFKLLLTQYVSLEIPFGSSEFAAIWHEITRENPKYREPIGEPSAFLFTAKGEAVYSGPNREDGMPPDAEFKGLLISGIEKNGGLRNPGSSASASTMAADSAKARKLLSGNQPLAAATLLSQYITPKSMPEDLAALVTLTGLKIAKSPAEEQLDSLTQQVTEKGLPLVESAVAEIADGDPTRTAVRLAELNRVFSGYPALQGKLDAAWKELLAKAQVPKLRQQAELIDEAHQAETAADASQAISAYERVSNTYPGTKAAELSQLRISQLRAPKKADSRVWKSKSEQFSVTAALVTFDGKSAQLRTTEGKTITVPFDSLSAEDQQFLKAAKP